MPGTAKAQLYFWHGLIVVCIPNISYTEHTPDTRTGYELHCGDSNPPSSRRLKMAKFQKPEVSLVQANLKAQRHAGQIQDCGVISVNETVRAIIDGQRKYFYDTFIIEDTAVNAAIDDYYTQTLSFGESFTDAAAFTTAYSTSPHQARFTEVYLLCNEKCKQRNPDPSIPSTAYTADDVAQRASDAGEAFLDSATHSVRRQAHQAQMDALRDVPIVGEVMQADNTLSLFGKLFRKK